MNRPYDRGEAMRRDLHVTIRRVMTEAADLLVNGDGNRAMALSEGDRASPKSGRRDCVRDADGLGAVPAAGA